jgi:ADP-L-glycero-D-manno-heptose 6-epimerase
MASVAYHFNNQLAGTGELRLFDASHGYAAGEQRRDFIYVDDVASVNLWFMERPHLSGIFNLGTGASRSFNDVARAVIDWHGDGDITYIPFPEHLGGRYQAFTEADLNALRRIGYAEEFTSVEAGVSAYLHALRQHGRSS